MKVYRLPDELPAPQVDYMNYDGAKAQAQEDAHKAALKRHFTDLGYTGKNTGRIYREAVADGYAMYMAVEAPRGTNAKVKFFLVHLPYVDGYQSRSVAGMTKKGIIDLIDFEEKFMSSLARR
jgi:hypothetical protein